MGRRRWVSVLSLAIIVAAAAYSGYWFHAADRARDAITRWAEDQRRHGIDIAYERVDSGGFPFLITVAIAGPRAQESAGDRWRWNGPAIHLSFRPWAFHEIAFAAPGQHRLVIGKDGAGREILARAAKADGLARLTASGEVAEVVLALADVIATESGADTTFERIEAKLTPLPERQAAADSGPSQPTAARLLLRASNTTLPMETALGRRIESVVAQIDVHGALRPAATTAQSLAAWRDDGGTLEVTRCQARWNTLDLAFDATLALDQDLQPIGAGRAIIRGFAETIDAFARAGLMRPAEAALAKLGLGVVARTPSDGGRPELDVPLTLQDRRLSAGPVRVLTVPRIHWN